MKDIRFWRAEYPEDKIACDETNTDPKINALTVVEDEIPLKAELLLLYFLFYFFFWEDTICATKSFLGTNETRVYVWRLAFMLAWASLVVFQHASGVGAAPPVMNTL